MNIWIDPPGGWRFGFPKIYSTSRDGDVHAWLVEQGYPQAEIDKLGKSFYWRSWEAEDQESEFQRGIPTRKV